MKRQALYFLAPGQVEVVAETLPEPTENQLLVRTLLSAVSPGTEMLFYRGQVPPELLADAEISSLQNTAGYPLKYGYCSAGEVVDASSPAGREWVGRKVFAFHPHESHFWAGADELIPLPDNVHPERAVFLPNMETALNFIHDGRPLAGEFVGVLGLGVVGLLTAALLAQFPLAGLVGFDRYPLRRKAGLAAGLHTALDPQDDQGWSKTERLFQQDGMADGLDLCFEVSGAPAALDRAIQLSGFSARVVVGSWYGSKPVQLNLGGAFHRSRIHLISSQVSSIAPELSGRWGKARRFGEALRQLGRVRPEGWISRRLPVDRAPEAYRLLDEEPGAVIQLVFEYGSDS